MRTEITSTDRQAANAALAALAAAGNGFALGQLWEINQDFVGQQVWKWYTRNQGTAQAHGLTLEDLKQEGFFAVQYAAEHYSPEKAASQPICPCPFKGRSARCFEAHIFAW